MNDIGADPGAMMSATKPAASRHPRVAEIEVLRGGAIIAVLVFHMCAILLPRPIGWLTHLTTYYVNFWGGVDVFFAISGFVIARTLVTSLRQCGDARDCLTAVQVFWIRRAFRLLPAAWLWLGLSLAGAAFLNHSGAWGPFHANWESAFAGLLSVANIRFAQAFLHYDYGVTAPYWSLSLEEQFYLCFPILIILAGRRLPQITLAILLAVAVIPETLMLDCFRIQAILLGVLLALLSQTPFYGDVEPTILAHHRWARRFLTALALLTIAALAPPGQLIAPHRFDFVALLAAALVFLASYGKGYLCTDGVARRALIWTANRSYALYLTHMPAIALTHEIFFRLLSQQELERDRVWTLPIIITALALSFALAELSRRLVEVPMRDKGKVIASRLAARRTEERLARTIPQTALPAIGGDT